MHKNDIIAVLSAIVGFSSLSADAAFSSQLSSLFGANATTIVAVLGLLGTLASFIIRVVNNPTTPSTPVVVPTVDGSSAVVDASNKENGV